MTRPIRIVGLDRAGVAVSSVVRRPGRLHADRRADWMLELPASDAGPPLGHPVVAVPSSS